MTAPEILKQKSVDNSLGKFTHLNLGFEASSPIDNRVHNLEMEIGVYKNASHVITVILPGLDAEFDGYHKKNAKLADLLHRTNQTAVVRSSNYEFIGCPEDANFRATMEYINANSYSICGETNYELNLMGHAAGAGIVAAYASEYKASRILLTSPLDVPDRDTILNGIKNFGGDVTILIGGRDPHTGNLGSEILKSIKSTQSRKSLFVLPGADHFLSGTENAQILSKAPFFAFLPEHKMAQNFPSPKGGVVLY